MAIINSTVMGKTRGKIGNVVTTVLKGQVIAKSRNYAPANPKTVLQVNSRAKMSNAVMAWQFLSIFLVNITPLRKSTESTYNAFVRFTKNFYEDTIASTRALAAYMITTQSFGFGNLVTSISMGNPGNSLEVTFGTGGSVKPSDLLVRAITYSSIDGVSVVTERLVTSQEWIDGQLDITTIISVADCAAVYFYSKLENKCSGVQFGAI